MPPTSDTGVAAPSQMHSHRAARQRPSAKPSEKRMVDRMTMATIAPPSEGRTNAGPHAGGDGLLLLANSVRRDGRHYHDGVAYPLQEQSEGDARVQGMHGIAVA